jgi:homoserine O-acetyltransferase/O-succinyltransferase
MTTQFYHSNKSMHLESGEQLENIQIAYHTYGKLNNAKDNVIWVVHAFTANSDVFDWWNSLFGADKYFDPKDYFIVCANNLGSCYGTTGPLNNKANQKNYFSNFPRITTRDMAASLNKLKIVLGIENIGILIGASQGGQIAMEWVLNNTVDISQLVLIATNAQHSSWGKAFNSSQRLAIFADSTYYDNKIGGGDKGMQAARSIALLSYRSYFSYKISQVDGADFMFDHKAETYQKYQGEKLVKRFNAYSYVALSHAVDSHNIARNRRPVKQVLSEIKIKTIVIGITSDLLFPPDEQKLLADNIPNATYYEIDSEYGHDGFLIDTNKLITIFEKQKIKNYNNKLIKN